MKRPLFFLVFLFSYSYAMEKDDLVKYSKPNDSKLDVCGICLSSLGKEWFEKSTLCSFESGDGTGYHTFCSKCIGESIKKGTDSCPICREPISRSTIWNINSKNLLLENSKKDRYSELNFKKIIESTEKSIGDLEKDYNVVCKAYEDTRKRENILFEAAKKLVKNKKKEEYLIENPRSFCLGLFSAAMIYWCYALDCKFFG